MYYATVQIFSSRSLTGYYNPAWNPGFSNVQTGSYISMAQGIGYMSPFFTAFVAEALLGDYRTILIFTILFYIPGLFLIAVVSIPYSLNTQNFPKKALKVGTHILFPLGFGAAKTLYGVYAAKQYDPKTQAEKTKQFFVTFTAVEFIGSFLGAVVCIYISTIGHFIASGFTNAAVLVIGIIVFIFGYGRYVNDELKRDRYMLMLLTIVDAISCCKRTNPNENNKNHMSHDMDKLLRDSSQDIDGSLDESNDQGRKIVTDSNNTLAEEDTKIKQQYDDDQPVQAGRRRSNNRSSRFSIAAPGFAKARMSHGGRKDDSVVDGMVQLLWLFPIYALLTPYNVAFTSVSSVAMLQCKFMQNSGPFNGPMLVSTSYLFIGFWAVLIKKYITPFLGRKNIILTISNKFVLGSLFLTLGFAVNAFVGSQMIRVYSESGGAISILYGLFATFFIGGMAFSLAATNELAFVIAPTELKMLGTAVMLFMTQGIPNILGAQLFRRCGDWFDVNGVQASTLEEYVHSDSLNFMYVLIGFTLFDVILFSLPPVRRWMDNFEEISKANNLRADAEGNTATYSTNNVLSTISENNVSTIILEGRNHDISEC
jgi:MFS family permease